MKNVYEVIENEKIRDMTYIANFDWIAKEGYKKFSRETSFRKDNKRVAILHRVIDTETSVLYNIEEILNFIKEIPMDENEEKYKIESFRVIRLSSKINVVYVDEQTFFKRFKPVNVKGILFDECLTYMFNIDKGEINKDERFTGKIYLMKDSRIKGEFIEIYAENGLKLHINNVERFVKENINNEQIPEEIRKRMKGLLIHDLIKMIFK